MMRWMIGLLKSFNYALEGIVYGLTSGRNMKIHVMATIIVMTGAFYFKMKSSEILLLAGTCLFVIIAEMINTAIEKTVDLVTKQFHPDAKIAKDVAAGAVFLAASLSVFIGIHVFYPYIVPNATISSRVLFAIIFIFLVVLLLGKAILMKRKDDHNGNKKIN